MHDNIQGDKINGDKIDGDKIYGNKNIFNVTLPKDEEPAGARESYLNRIIERTNKLSLAGIDPKAASDQAAAQLSLQAVYIGLVTTSAEKQSGLQVPLFINSGRQLSAVSQMNQHDRLVIMGDPGSGKSTFVNFVALCMAGACLGREDINLHLLTAPLPDEQGKDKEERQTWEHGFLLPVLVVLRHFATKGLPISGEKGTAEHLWQFIAQELKQAALEDYAPYLLRTLRQEGGILLLDGLDEVPEAHRKRVQIKEVVEDFAAVFPKVRIVITSRTYAYQKQDWRLPDFSETILAPFGPGQIRRFIDAWYEHVGVVWNMIMDDARGKAVILKERIFDNERLMALAERPLLLTLMASLHAWRGGSLPEKREELYNDAVELLLDWWESPKVERDAQGNVISQQRSLAELLKVGRDKVRTFLHELAYEAHKSQSETTKTADIAEGALLSGLLRLNRSEEVNPELLIRYLSDRAGLLLPRGEGVYTFPHRTFQEYLAACHLADYGYPDEVAELARQEPNRWREVALLAGAKTARGGAFAVWPLVNALCYEEPEAARKSAEAAWGALLASQVLVETADLDRVSKSNQRHVDRVRRSLVALIKGNELPPVERALAGNNLAVLGDPRPGVGIVVINDEELPDIELCYVPPGPFWMGSPDDDPYADDREKPLHQIDLDYGYWIGRYPVANAQFRLFLTQSNYEVQGRFKEYALTEPATWPARFVTWDDALAFCGWMTERSTAFGWLSPDMRITLPSEAEWEKAARGGLMVPKTVQTARLAAGLKKPIVDLIPNADPQRRYPMGETLRPYQANYKAAGVGKPSAVGIFPDDTSPLGLMDLAGNVNEWTRSSYKEYPYDPEDGREDLKSRDVKVIRGGGYYDDENWPRCSYRGRLNPRYDFNDFGIRVAVASPFSSSDL